MRLALAQSVSFSVFVALLGSASAGTINLTGGSFDPSSLIPSGIPTGGPVHFEGDRGFTFDGSVGGDEGSQVSGCDFCTPAVLTGKTSDGTSFTSTVSLQVH